jgi:hypothetical protein
MAETHQGETAATTIDFDHHSGDFLDNRYDFTPAVRVGPSERPF